MYKLRASYTFLNKWASGDWQGATEMYFRLDSFTSRQMAEGRDYHESWKEETDKTGKLPKVFGGFDLISPKTELELIVPVQKWLDLKVIIDCLDAPVIHEYKRTGASPDSYARSKQASLYAVACTLKGIVVDKAQYHTYDPATNQVGTASVWLTDKIIDETYDWLITYASEVYNYFQENNLFEQFASRRN